MELTQEQIDRIQEELEMVLPGLKEHVAAIQESTKITPEMLRTVITI